MQLPEGFSEPKVLSIALGALGAAFSMAFIKDMHWFERFVMILIGTIITALFAQPIIDLLHAPPGWSNGISFLVGTLGWSVVGALLKATRRADLWGLASEIVRSWFMRRGD